MKHLQYQEGSFRMIEWGLGLGEIPLSLIFGIIFCCLSLGSTSFRIIPIRWELLENHYDFSILATLVSVPEDHEA